MRTECPAYLLRAWGSFGGLEPLDFDSDSDIEEVPRGVVTRGPLGKPARQCLQQPQQPQPGEPHDIEVVLILFPRISMHIIELCIVMQCDAY